MGIITPSEALSGFANPGVVLVGAMFVIAAGMRNTGVLDWVGQQLLGRAKSDASALRRLTAALMPSSAFMPNTPVVAMMVPVVVDWCRKHNVSPSRLLIPVSYLSILGGVCTLVGTSTTLVVQAALRTEKESNRWLNQPEFRRQLEEMSLFEIGQVGLPCALVGAAVLIVFARRLLPTRQDIVADVGEHRREYLVEMLVRPECRLIGKSVEDAGLRGLTGLFLIEINRGGEILAPVTPKDVIQSGDRLVFTGVVATIVDLERIAGLVPAADLAYEVRPDERHQRHLTEAVLSRTSPLIGRTVRAANFRQRYGAAVVAVHRNGQRVTNKIGSIVLEAGDTLLLQTRTDFTETFRDNADFYLVSAVEGSTPPRHERALLSAVLMLALVVWLSATDFPPIKNWDGFNSPAVAAVVIASLFVATGCLPISAARSALDLQVLITIAAAIGLGQALSKSGAAGAIAGQMVEFVGQDQPYLLLVILFVLTVAFGELMSNNAVAAMMFPLAVQLAYTGGYSPRPFIMGVALAASFSFLTPVGYQTNLMVMGPGGYRPMDFVRAGWPVSLAVSVTALVLIPFVWPF
jgi:di/tricarboxylate transporter